MTDTSNYDFHLSLRQTILIKDVWLTFLTYPTEGKKEEKMNVHFFSCDNSSYVPALVYLWSELISSEWWRRGRENVNHIVLYTVNTYAGTFVSLRLSFFFTLLPLQPGTPGIPRGPIAPGCPGKPFWPSIGNKPSSPYLFRARKKREIE